MWIELFTEHVVVGVAVVRITSEEKIKPGLAHSLPGCWSAAVYIPQRRKKKHRLAFSMPLCGSQYVDVYVLYWIVEMLEFAEYTFSQYILLLYQKQV